MWDIKFQIETKSEMDWLLSLCQLTSYFLRLPPLKNEVADDAMSFKQRTKITNYKSPVWKTQMIKLKPKNSDGM